MTTQLLAETNGWISIIEVQKKTHAYLVFRYAMETKTHKAFIAEQGTKWELFQDVVEAENWIKSKNNPEVN